MGEAMESALSPREAIKTLEKLGTYEERLTARTGGMTTMVWGLVGAGAFMTYAAAGNWPSDAGIPWLYSLLWLPWIVGGIVYTNSLWQTLSVTLKKPDSRGHTILISVGYTALFFALMFLLWVTGLAGRAPMGTNMTFVIGLFQIALGIIFSTLAGIPWRFGGFPMIAAGLAVLAIGGLLLYANPHEVAAGLTGGFAGGLGFFSAGLYAYLRG